MDGICWPSRMLLVLQSHLQHVEHPSVPRIPPLATTGTTHSVLSFLHGARETIQQRCKASESVVECCENLVLDTIEQCCASSFLSAKERRFINLAAVQHEKRREGHHGSKRRRGDKEVLSSMMEEEAETDAGVSANTSSYKCVAVLPIEYLLRFFVALPSILAHYDKLGGCAMPPAYKQPLWDYVNAVLEIMNGMAFIDTTNYALLK